MKGHGETWTGIFSQGVKPRITTGLTKKFTLLTRWLSFTAAMYFPLFPFLNGSFCCGYAVPTSPLHNTCEGRSRTCPLVYRSPDHSESKHHPEILHLNAGAGWNSVDVPIRDAVVLCVEKKDSTFRNKWIFNVQRHKPNICRELSQ